MKNQLLTDIFMALSQRVLQKLIVAIVSITVFPLDSFCLEKNGQDMGRASYHEIGLDEAYLKLPKNQWSFGIPKHLLDQPVPIFQHRVHQNIIGNLISHLKVTHGSEIFSSLETLKKQCQLFKEVYEKLGIKKISYQVRFQERGSKIPLCWIQQESEMGQRVQVFLFTKRSGKTKDFSYSSHQFTFNFPTGIKEIAMTELEQFFLNIHYQ